MIFGSRCGLLWERVNMGFFLMLLRRLEDDVIMGKFVLYIFLGFKEGSVIE